MQPVLVALDREVEEAAANLGANRFTTFRWIVLPAILPAIADGAALAFAGAMGEYGSVVLISGGLQFKTEISSPTSDAVEATVTRLQRVGFEVSRGAAGLRHRAVASLTRGQAESLALRPGDTVWLRPARDASTLTAS